MEKISVIAVVGPTASGKTALAVELARAFDGEIISADSMQIYKGISIATAKPSEEEKKGVRHHLMDFLDLDEQFSVALFTEMAGRAAADIRSRGKLPVIAGGTGLYVDSFLNNVQLTDGSFDEKVRERLIREAEESGMEKMLERLAQTDPGYAAKVHINNKKRILRALELYETTGVTMSEQLEKSRRESIYDCCKIFLTARDRKVLYDRINTRVDRMLEAGLVDETRRYFSSVSGATSSQAIGYKELRPYLDGEMTLEEAVEKLKMSTRRYAKRQLTWFNRDESAHRLYIDDYKDSAGLFENAAAIVAGWMKGAADERQRRKER